MHFTGPVQSEVLIIYILLMVIKASIVTDNLSKNMTGTSTNSSVKAHMYLHSKPIRDQIKTLRYVWMQVRYALRHIQGKKEELQKFYAQALPALNPSHEDKLLPTAPSDDFHAVRHLEKHMKVSQMFPVFYNNSELYQILFQNMMDLKFNPQNQHVAQPDFYEKRQIFLSTFEEDLNSILYQLENTFQVFKLKTEHVNSKEVIARWHQREPSRDYTSILYHDWIVITRYYRYIKGWNKILTEIFQNYCDIMAANHKCRRYLRGEER